MGTVRGDQVSFTKGKNNGKRLFRRTVSEEHTMGSLEGADAGGDVADAKRSARSDEQQIERNVEIRHADEGRLEDGEDEEPCSDFLERDEEDITRSEHGLGPLWRLSLFATLVFVAWAFVGGVGLACRNSFPDIREREPVQTILVRRRRPRRTSSPDPTSSK